MVYTSVIHSNSCTRYIRLPHFDSRNNCVTLLHNYLLLTTSKLYVPMVCCWVAVRKGKTRGMQRIGRKDVGRGEKGIEKNKVNWNSEENTGPV